MKCRLLYLAGVLSVLLAAFGCGKGSIGGTLIANRPPKIAITCGAVNSNAANPLTLPYSVTFCWSSSDTDGFVDHFEYAVMDSDTLDTRVANLRTTKLHKITVQYPASISNPALDDTGKVQYAFTHPSEFLVRAVDNEGRKSPWDYRFFNAFTVAPTSTLIFPGGGFSLDFAGPTITARWSGSDLDSSDPRRIPKTFNIYFKDISPAPDAFDIPLGAAIIRQTLRVPPITVPGDSTSMVLKLTIGHTYCIVVKAKDEAGAEEPLPSLNEGPEWDLRDYLQLTRNCAILRSSPDIAGPSLQVQAGLSFGNATGYDPTRPTIRLEEPVGVPIPIQWIGSAKAYGGEVAGYRYALDIDDPTSDNPRVIQPGGFTWTQLDERALTAVLTGFPAAGVHYFYIECIDNSGYRTIAIVQITIVAASFDRPLLMILDDPNLPSDPPGLGQSLLTQREMKDWWMNVLETDRYYVDLSDTLTYPGGRCLPLTTQDSTIFLVPKQNRIVLGVPLAVLARYRVVIWYSPVAANEVVPSALHTQVDGSAANNLFTFLQAGGNVVLFGGGAALNLTQNQRYPITPQSVPNQRATGPFVLDALGIVGDDTLFTTDLVDRSTSGGIDKSPPIYDGRARQYDPWPAPFVRQTLSGRTQQQMPSMSIDFGRYDTLDFNRFPNPRVYYIPLHQEIISGLPTQYNPDPDSSTWQPLYLYRTLGSQAVTFDLDVGNRLFMDNTIAAWYKRGTTLTNAAGAPISAPYQLYYFGFGLQYCFQEQVRSVMDIIFSTKGWNIWRGGCPSGAPRATIEREQELQRNWAHVSSAQRAEFDREIRASYHARARQRSR